MKPILVLNYENEVVEVEGPHGTHPLSDGYVPPTLFPRTPVRTLSDYDE